MEFLFFIALLFIAKPLIKAILDALSSSCPTVVNNTTKALANVTESLPTLGLSVAAENLMDLEVELNDLNSRNGTSYTSFREIVDKYKKIGG